MAENLKWKGREMTNNQIQFIGAAVLVAGGVIAFAIGMGTTRGEGPEFPGAIAMVLGLVLGIRAFLGMRKDGNADRS